MQSPNVVDALISLALAVVMTAIVFVAIGPDLWLALGTLSTAAP